MTEELKVHQFRAMASPIEVQTVLDSSQADWLFRVIETEFEASEQSLSRFREDSDLTQLNRRTGQFEEVSPRLYEAVSLAYRAYRLTHGLFDPRIITVLERIGYAGASVKGAGPAENPGGLGNQEWLCRKPRQRALQLLEPIDLGGIGKGLTVRRASKIARQTGKSFLVNGGGDLYVWGPGPVDGKWSLGIENPFTQDSLAAAIAISGGFALCTSSTKNRHWQHGDRPVHHLIHPFTGQPGGEGLRSVTVLGRDPMWSEIFTKYLFLLGKEGISGIAKALGMTAWWIYSDGSLGMTERAVSCLTWIHQDLKVREVV